MNRRRTFFFLLFMAAYWTVIAQESNKSLLLKDLSYLASDELEGREPLTEGSLKTRAFIIQRFDSLEITSQYRDYTQYFTLRDDRGKGIAFGQAANIIGYIPGQQSGKIIVITAHFDHLGKKEDRVYNGADDNASGTAGLLAMAAYFSRNKPFCAILFAALDGEEMWLQGARALVSDFPFPLEEVLLNVNMDMISRSDKDEIFAAGTRHYPQFRGILEESAEDAEIQLRFGHDEPGTGREDWTTASDHAAFHDKGIPFIYFGVEDHKDYHQTTDTYENVDHEFYFQAVNLIIRAVRDLDESLYNSLK